MPSPPAIAIAVIGMLALGVGLGSAMSEVASSAPISTPDPRVPPPRGRSAARRRTGRRSRRSSEEETCRRSAGRSGCRKPSKKPPPEEVITPLPEEPIAAKNRVPKNRKRCRSTRSKKKKNRRPKKPLPEIKHAFLIVLGENSYESTYGTTAEAPYLSRVAAGEGRAAPQLLRRHRRRPRQRDRDAERPGPDRRNRGQLSQLHGDHPGTVSETAEQVEGTGCVYGKEVKSLPTQLEEKDLTWRAYVEDMENGGAIGQPWRCRKPTLGGPDTADPGARRPVRELAQPGRLLRARSPKSAECEKHDVGFEMLTKDLKYEESDAGAVADLPRTPATRAAKSNANRGRRRAPRASAQLLKTLVPAIMASPAYEEGGMILITSAQAPQAGEQCRPERLLPGARLSEPGRRGRSSLPRRRRHDDHGNVDLETSTTSTTEAATELEDEAEPTKYTEESVLETRRRRQGRPADDLALRRSGQSRRNRIRQPLHPAEDRWRRCSASNRSATRPKKKMPTLSPSLFRSAEEVEAEAAEKAEGKGRGEEVEGQEPASGPPSR